MTDRKDEIRLIADRVLSRVAVDAAGCWIWQGCKTPKGYGMTSSKKINGRKSYTHRIMYEDENGPIGEGLQIDHLCRVTQCCNPAHLEAVTPRENTMRGDSPRLVSERRKTHCLRGHAYTEQNTYVSPSGVRSCRDCRRAVHDALTEKRRAASPRHRRITAKQLAIRIV